MARTILSSGDTASIGGTNAEIFFNATGNEVLHLDPGTTGTLFGFQRGGETIRFDGPASAYDIKATANNVTITHADGTSVTFGVGSIPGTIQFAGGADSRSISFANNAVTFGNQTLVPGVVTDVAPGAGTYSIAPADGAVFHDEGVTVTFVITRTTSNVAEELVYSVAGDNNGGTVNPAVGGQDFLNGGGTVSFAAGETSKQVTVTLASDALVEGVEGYKVTVFKGAAAVTSVVGLIRDVDGTDPNAVTLTSSVDVKSGNVFNGQPVYTPGGNDLVNSLQDEDVLTGTGVNPTLNVTLGSVNDGAESVVSPVLNNIQTVNVGLTGNAGGINFQDTTGLTTLNLNRLTQTNGSARFEDLDRTVTNISVNNVTRGGEVHFHYREEVLTQDETLNLGINNARVSDLHLTDDTDGGADAGYFFETVNVATTGNNDIDQFRIQANSRETGRQELNITANGTPTTGSLEINDLQALGVDEMTIVANARVDIAADKLAVLDDSNDGISTPDLEKLTITGAANVAIDGLDTSKQAAGITLTVDASAMTGNLKLGIETPSDGLSSGTYANRTDKDLIVTSGSGDDEIRTYGVLAGDISTGEGDDIVAIRNDSNSADADVEGVSTINAGNGDNVVTARDLEATASDNNQAENSGFDDVTAARIITGSGNDTVSVRDLESSQDRDNKTLNDGNADDVYQLIGARIETGAGDDQISLRSVAEGASVDAGAGDDTLNVSLSNNNGNFTILAGDTDADIETLVPGGGSRTREVTAAGVADRLGAVVDLGSGSNDVANFLEQSSLNNSSITVVGRDAELRGAETVNVRALDLVTVTTNTSMVDQDDNAANVQTDINANVIGTKTLNLTVANQIDNPTATATGTVQNDTSETNGAIVADVLRFDSALTNINLVSEEQAMLRTAVLENYEAGTSTSFTLHNLREEIALTLRANEATGVIANALVDDSVLAINTTTGLVTTNAGAVDVVLNVDYDGARGNNNAAALVVDAASGAFDLDLNIGTTLTDKAATNAAGNNGNAASATDDDAQSIENFTVTFQDGNSHSIDANGFGDVAFRATRPAAVGGDVSSTAATSFVVRSAAGAGKTIAVDAVNADKIEFLNVDGTAVTAANVVLRVDADNNYSIKTGTGSDTIDMRRDNVRSDDVSTALDRADRIDAGAGRDTLIVNGTDSLGVNNNIEGGVASTIIDDDVFAGLRGIEKILVDGDQDQAGTSNAAKSLDITLDEEAKVTGVDTISLVGTAQQEVNLEIGNNFAVQTTVDNTNGQLTTATSALVIDASLHTGQTLLNIESKDDDTDIQLINLDIRVDSDGGTVLNLVNTGDPSAQVDVRVYTADEGDAHTISSANAGNIDGLVDINVTTGTFDRLIVLEGENANSGGAEGAMSIAINSNWTGSAFVVDASAVADTDGNLATGGATISAAVGDTAALTLRGTQNTDVITGGRGKDVIEGNAGNDTLIGDEVVNQRELEVVTFATSYDNGDVITVTHNGQTMTATITADGVTGADVAFAMATYDALGGLDFLFFDNINVTGPAFGAADATSNAATRQLRLEGATAGIDYLVAASTNNAGDNVAQRQVLTLQNNSSNVTVVFNGTAYAINASNGAGAWTALSNAVTAAGGTLTLQGVGNALANDVAIITGPATGVDFPLITQATAVTPANVVSLTFTTGDLGTDQPNPQVVTETLARTVLGDADTILGGSGNDIIAGLTGGDTLDGGDGVDTLDYTLSLQGVNIDLGANSASGGDAQGDIISNFESVLGTAYNDVLTGNAQGNLLVGGAGNDTLSGGAGSDDLQGGVGSDRLIGGTGSDTIDVGVDTDIDTVVFASGDGLDIVANFVHLTDKIEFTDFADRDLAPGSLLFQAANAGTNVAISGNNTELLVVNGANFTGGGSLEQKIADAIDGAFQLGTLADGRVIFAVKADTDGVGGADTTYVGYYTDTGNDGTNLASEIEVLATFNTANIDQNDFWLPGV